VDFQQNNLLLNLLYNRFYPHHQSQQGNLFCCHQHNPVVNRHFSHRQVHYHNQHVSQQLNPPFNHF
jgi:hypothetical protein